jgi:hypothetical protein
MLYRKFGWETVVQGKMFDEITEVKNIVILFLTKRCLTAM